MDDHYSWMRSANYFKVRDPEAFKAFVAKYDLTWHTDKDDDQETEGCRYGFMAIGNTDKLTCYYWDEKAGEFVYTDFIKELLTHLAPDDYINTRDKAYTPYRVA